MVRFLSLTVLSFIVLLQVSHGEVRILSSDPQQIATNTYAFIMSNSTARINEKRCAAPLREGILKVLRSKSVEELASQNLSLHQIRCLDRFSRFVSFNTGESLSSTSAVRALKSRTVVGFDLSRNTRYVYIKRFSDTTANEFASDTYRSVPRNLILDLRDNLGGNLRAAESIAQMFATSSEQILATYVLRTRVDVLASTSAGLLKNTRVIILVNRDTSSASEFLAGIVRQKKDTLLVGERTYGKGVFQNTIDLGSGVGLNITVGEYFIGQDRVAGKVDGRGLIPDIVLSDPYPREVDKDPVVKLAQELLD